MPRTWLAVLNSGVRRVRAGDTVLWLPPASPCSPDPRAHLPSLHCIPRHPVPPLSPPQPSARATPSPYPKQVDTGPSSQPPQSWTKPPMSSSKATHQTSLIFEPLGASASFIIMERITWESLIHEVTKLCSLATLQLEKPTRFYKNALETSKRVYT